MACVLTVAVVEDGCAVVGHVGDSRLYHVRRGEIRKITHDHSPVGEREDNGELSEFEAMRHPRRNEVFRDVGAEERSPDDPDFIEIERVPFAADSALVLCSDGLSDLVPSNRIRAAVEGHAGHPEETVKQLIEEANAEGGKDNITVVVVEGEKFGQAPAARNGALAGRAAMFVYGAALAAAAAFGAYWFTRPAPVKPPHVPAVLTAGQGAPFPTLTEAMNVAQPGDSIEVLPGEYSEQVSLKSGVTLRSRVPHGAVLRAAAWSRGPAVIAEKVQAARFSGFRIVADKQKPLTAGIELADSDIEVSDVEVEGAGVGIEIRGGGTVSLVGNTIQDCLAEGVLIAGTSTPWISHNLIRRNKGAAIAAREGARPVLDGNAFEKGTLELPPELRPVPAATPRKKP